MLKCEECNREFPDENSLKQHKLDRHEKAKQLEIKKQVEKSEEEKQKNSEQKLIANAKLVKNLKTFGIITIIVIIIIAVGYWYVSEANAVKANAKAAGIPTAPIHWHPHLKIVINGEEQVIPANIGVTIGKVIDDKISMDGGGMSPTHTHAADSIIHLENNAPWTKPETLTLGYFFDIWEKTFSETCIFEYCNSDNATVKMFVNGKQNFEFGNYIMRDGDKIEIRYE